ncbi:flavodoxin [Nesterenkonia sp. AN1]|uniref:flavodoxin family protein n=1 Tax=Nesterenkonia sp. AN1 TaxID=652017 RepID=UPI00044EDB7D|nr:flavodoxin family protein [Nesterenkonia sp. AN1]EXF24700.1 flavodoxin [Nesterenkonia sp. AN1]
MDAVIVYESAWGNTKIIAEAVAEGLVSAIDVGMILDVSFAPPADTITADLLVLGAPTHAFGLSRPQTREEAARRGGHPGDTGIREWIGAAGDLHLPVAVFDTHVRHPNLPGAASKKAAKLLRSHGASLLAKPESFYVEGYEGPVLPGEIDRARKWGAELAQRLPESSRVA